MNKFIISLLFISTVTAQCLIQIPDDPLSAIGLATPYQVHNCDQTNVTQASFAEAVILNTQTGELRIYTPLLINAGTQPLVSPIVPQLCPYDIVGIWFGSNANQIILTDTTFGTLKKSNCVNGLPGDPFGQVAACNARDFFLAANALVRNGILSVPPLGMGRNGKTCYTTRSFEIVDQDQSDNVVSSYIVLNGMTAQYNTANINQFPTATVLKNPSDNGLLVRFVLPALGCTPFTAPDITNNGTLRGAQALDEIQARLYQQTPFALVPLGDPMTLVNGNFSVQKTNAYRRIVNQHLVTKHYTGSITEYCTNLLNIGGPSILNDKPFTFNITSPDPMTASNLFAFLGSRFIATLTNLNCANYVNFTPPFTLVTNINGIVTDLTPTI